MEINREEYFIVIDKFFTNLSGCYIDTVHNDDIKIWTKEYVKKLGYKQFEIIKTSKASKVNLGWGVTHSYKVVMKNKEVIDPIDELLQIDNSIFYFISMDHKDYNLYSIDKEDLKD